jgi:hypothetical protein
MARANMSASMPLLRTRQSRRAEILRAVRTREPGLPAKVARATGALRGDLGAAQPATKTNALGTRTLTGSAIPYTRN